jgi:hypothetical protein
MPLVIGVDRLQISPSSPGVTHRELLICSFREIKIVQAHHTNADHSRHHGFAFPIDGDGITASRRVAVKTCTELLFVERHDVLSPIPGPSVLRLVGLHQFAHLADPSPHETADHSVWYLATPENVSAAAPMTTAARTRIEGIMSLQKVGYRQGGIDSNLFTPGESLVEYSRARVLLMRYGQTAKRGLADPLYLFVLSTQ